MMVDLMMAIRTIVYSVSGYNLYTKLESTRAVIVRYYHMSYTGSVLRFA